MRKELEPTYLINFDEGVLGYISIVGSSNWCHYLMKIYYQNGNFYSRILSGGIDQFERPYRYSQSWGTSVNEYSFWHDVIKHAFELAGGYGDSIWFWDRDVFNEITNENVSLDDINSIAHRNKERLYCFNPGLSTLGLEHRCPICQEYVILKDNWYEEHGVCQKCHNGESVKEKIW